MFLLLRVGELWVPLSLHLNLFEHHDSHYLACQIDDWWKGLIFSKDYLMSSDLITVRNRRTWAIDIFYQTSFRCIDVFWKVGMHLFLWEALLKQLTLRAFDGFFTHFEPMLFYWILSQNVHWDLYHQETLIVSFLPLIVLLIYLGKPSHLHFIKSA